MNRYITVFNTKATTSILLIVPPRSCKVALSSGTCLIVRIRCRDRTSRYTVRSTLTTRVDVQTYGLNGLNNTESTFNHTNLEAPVLNISSYFESAAQGSYVNDGQIYSLEYIKKNGSCQPNPEDDNGDLVSILSFPTSVFKLMDPRCFNGGSHSCRSS